MCTASASGLGHVSPPEGRAVLTTALLLQPLTCYIFTTALVLPSGGLCGVLTLYSVSSAVERQLRRGVDFIWLLP